jgi:hypothetical protein
MRIRVRMAIGGVSDLVDPYGNWLASKVRISNTELRICGSGSVKKYPDPYYFITDSKKFQKKVQYMYNFNDLLPIWRFILIA